MRVSVFDPLKLQQGTVFVFTDTNTLLTRALQNTDIVISPSVFACLNLPDWYNDNEHNGQKFFVHPSEFNDSTMVEDANQLVPALLQNYLDNCSLLTTSLIDDANTTFVESAFWKMLQKTSTFEPTIQDDGSTYMQRADWQPIVTYIGNAIDFGVVNVNGMEYTESYLYIPATAKKCKAKWQSVTYSGVNVGYVPEEFEENAQGLQDGDTTFVKAIYDNADVVEPASRYSLSRAVDRLALQFTDYETVNEDITFNCIALYCDVWLQSNPSVKTRCLHSLFFVNKYEESGGNGYAIQKFTKKAIADNGSSNALAFRICTRVSSCNTGLAPIDVTNIDGVSLDLYMQAIAQLAESSNQLQTLKIQVEQLQTQLNSLLLSIGNDQNAMIEIAKLKKQLLEQGMTVSPAELLDAFIEVSKQMKSQEPGKQVLVTVTVNTTNA